MRSKRHSAASSKHRRGLRHDQTGGGEFELVRELASTTHQRLGGGQLSGKERKISTDQLDALLHQAREISARGRVLKLAGVGFVTTAKDRAGDGLFMDSAALTAAVMELSHMTVALESMLEAMVDSTSKGAQERCDGENLH